MQISQLQIYALEYGGLGLASICIAYTVYVISQEQKRKGALRTEVIDFAKTILKFSAFFVVFLSLVKIGENHLGNTSSLVGKDNEISDLKKSVDNERKRISTLEQSLSEEKESNKNLSSENDSLKEGLLSHRKEISSLEDQLEEKDQTIRIIEKKLPPNPVNLNALLDWIDSPTHLPKRPKHELYSDQLVGQYPSFEESVLQSNMIRDFENKVIKVIEGCAFGTVISDTKDVKMPSTAPRGMTIDMRNSRKKTRFELEFRYEKQNPRYRYATFVGHSGKVYEYSLTNLSLRGLRPFPVECIN